VGSTFNTNGNTASPDGFEEQRQWARDDRATLAPFYNGVYVDFLMEEGHARVRQAYGDTKLRGLTTLKRTFDLTVFLRRIQLRTTRWRALNDGAAFRPR
jgi:hypothetical protein